MFGVRKSYEIDNRLSPGSKQHVLFTKKKKKNYPTRLKSKNNETPIGTVLTIRLSGCSKALRTLVTGYHRRVAPRGIGNFGKSKERAPISSTF